jgi:hypothetical protein
MHRIPQSDHDGKHIIVVHQWEDRYAHYEDYFDHRDAPVSYVITPVGASSVPSTAADVVVVPRTGDIPLMRSTVSSLAERFGRPRAIIALKESVLPIVAQLREEFGAAGRRAGDLHRFLYKDAMVAAVQELDLETPRTAAAATLEDILAFGRTAGWPVVIKPVRGSASEGVHILRSPAAARNVRIDPGKPMLVQEFLPYPIVVVDGVWHGSAEGPWRMSRYVGNCLSFRHGAPLGFVEVDDARTNAAMGAYLEKLLPGLCDETFVYHLELFQVDEGDNCDPRFVFLEIAARVGGAETPFLWREVHGLDLMAVECELQLGRQPSALSDIGGGVAGYLLMPTPRQRPCRVTQSMSMLGPGGPYAEKVLKAGEIIPASEAFYEHVGGRFRFRGSSTAEVEASIRRVAAQFDIQTEGLEVTEGAACLPAQNNRNRISA